MKPRIPLRICRDCPHYRGYCPLTDLDPCPRTDLEDHRLRNFICWEAAALIVALLAAALLLSSCHRAPEPQPVVPKWSAVELLRNQHRNELSDFDKLIMAIAYTESRFNPDADSGQGDRGLLQLREIYISEVNRLYGTSYTVEDAFDADKSLAIFSALQAHYNPTKDIDRAIYYHNKSSQYRGRVMEVYEIVERYETIRAKLIEK